MGDGSLSQDEIDALLKGADDMLSSTSAPAASDAGRSRSGIFSQNELNLIRDTLNFAVGSVAPSLSGYLGGRNLRISRPFIEIKTQSAVRSDFPLRYIQVATDFSGVLNGRNLIVFNYSDAGSISSLMMGDDRGIPPSELSDAHQSTIQEFTNQLLSSMATQFSGSLGGGINTSPPSLSTVTSGADLQLPQGPDLLKVTYDFAIEGVLNSKLYHIMDISIGQGLTSATGIVAQPISQPQQFQPHPGQVGISPVKFPPLDEGLPPSIGGNISLILDVPMTLTVELGRTTQLVQDILGLGEGSIIELDKLAGEPVDLLVNGKLIAKGEVVVIDENFGVRVTDIVSPADRITGLQ
jgi:flagellar motor switch protein FliN/FliY